MCTHPLSPADDLFHAVVDLKCKAAYGTYGAHVVKYGAGETIPVFDCRKSEGSLKHMSALKLQVRAGNATRTGLR
jgi:hypothetical protein